MMKERIFALFGVIGPLIAYISIGISILNSPSFNWDTNALSDLGHAVNSDFASIYNAGLLIAGFFVIIFAVTIFRKHAKYTSISLIFLISTDLISSRLNRIWQ